METGAYRFTVGEFACIAVRDGGLNYPVGAMFANVPRSQAEEALREHGLPTDRVYTPYTLLFVDTGDHKVLVDTGAGNIGAHAPTIMPGIDHTTTVTGLVLENLTAEGIEPSTVDTVIITHAHPDHVEGTLAADGTLVFPNARYFIGEDEWRFWFSEDAAGQAPPPFVEMARHNLDQLRDRITMVHDGDEIVPGIRVIATPGHTPGHIALEITSGGETLIHAVDVVLHPLHLEHPDWLPVFDMLSDRAAESKERTFDRAAEEQCLVFAHHFPPFPNLGHVRKGDQGWSWEPILGTATPERAAQD